MLLRKAKRPSLSIVVIFHNMRREARRTLYTLSGAYQRDVCAGFYEIIAIDNGSSRALDREDVQKFGPNFTYIYFKTDSVSPAEAINYGCRNAKGDYIAVIVDGARMVTPGLVGASLKASYAFEDPFVTALAFHLGPDVQNISMTTGYNQVEEDRLLKSIDWRSRGYRLFEISTLAQSSDVGFIGGMPAECSWFVMPRATFLDMGGYEEKFQSPGGGLVNHDFLNRVLLRPTVCPVVILGEGVFHQFHGGVATNVPVLAHPWVKFEEEYMDIRAKPFKEVLSPPPFYFGRMPPETMQYIRNGIEVDG